ncbi:MAG: diguanylate cyclase [Leptospiraceae bacterium]|nr:diguanylate cyclase [Leptospiraceae bacterium]
MKSYIHKLFKNIFPNRKDGISLRDIFIIVFTLFIMTSSIVISYISYIYNHKSAHEMAKQLMNEVSRNVYEHIDSYLSPPRNIVSINHLLVKQGKLDIHDNRQLKRHLWGQINMFPLIESIIVANKTEFYAYRRDILGVSASVGSMNWLELKSTHKYQRRDYLVNEKGDEVKLIAKLPYNPSESPWYIQAQASKRQLWSPIFAWKLSSQLGLLAVSPIYNGLNQLQGVLASGVPLANLNVHLKNLPFSQMGTIFIIETNGKIVASSTENQPLTAQKGESSTRLKITEIQEPTIHFTATQLLKKFGNLQAIQNEQQFNIKNKQEYFVRVTPYRDAYNLNWLIVTVAPKSVFMKSFYESLYKIIILSILAILLAIVLGSVLTRWLTQPLISFNSSVKQMTTGYFERLSVISPVREIRELSQSFNNMIKRLFQSFEELQSMNKQLIKAEEILANYNKELEKRVSERTIALQQEIKERKKTEEFLRKTDLELRKANSMLQNLSRIDTLTQVANRRMFDEHLEREWRRSKREKQPLTIMMIDVDHFKKYNDHYGHQAGDKCLQHIAQAIKQVVNRPMDLVARYGGEEFVVILANTNTEGAVELAKKIQNRIQKINIMHEKSDYKTITLSIGIASVLPGLSTRSDSLLAQADKALYQAKHNGRNCYEVYHFNLVS